MLRIYGGVFSKKRAFDKGRKKKTRRQLRADHVDGWSRKRAGGLAPAFVPSKRLVADELKHYGM